MRQPTSAGLLAAVLAGAAALASLPQTAALKPLTGRVALVTGASRGIGKGIALELGAAGATVYCVARSSRGGFVSDDRPVAASVGELTVEQTAEEVSQSGGKGIPVPCDCSDENAIEEIIERIRSDEGRLDVVVPSAFATPPKLADAAFRDDFWKQGMEMWDCCHGVGLRGTYATLRKATPLLIETAQKYDTRPLACLISSFGGQAYTFNVAYGVGKAATDRLARDASAQLSKYNVDTISLYPGVVATEGNMEMEERGEWAAASGGLDLAKAETPRFSGRALVALLTNPEYCSENSGSYQVVSELASQFDFTDVDGRRAPLIRSLQYLVPNFLLTDDKIEAMPAWQRGLATKFRDEWTPDYLLPWSVFSGGPPPEQMS